MTDLAKGLPLVAACTLLWCAPPLPANRVANNPGAGGGGGYTVLASSDFEETGAPAGWTFNNSADPDYTPALAGDESAESGSATDDFDTAAWADTGEVWGYFILKVASADTSSVRNVQLRLNGSGISADINHRSSGVLRLECSGGTNSATAASQTGNTVHVKFHYRASVSSDGVFEAWVDSDGDFSSGAEHLDVGAHTDTSDVDQVLFEAGSNGAIVVDDVLITDGDPGDTPTLP